MHFSCLQTQLVIVYIIFGVSVYPTFFAIYLVPRIDWDEGCGISEAKSDRRVLVGRLRITMDEETHLLLVLTMYDLFEVLIFCFILF